MVKGEYVRIHMFDARGGDIPGVIYVRWDEGDAKAVQMGPQAIVSRRLILLMRALLITGLLTWTFLAIRFLQALVP